MWYLGIYILGAIDRNDVLRGEKGNDRLTGGLRADAFSAGAGTDIATDFTPSQGAIKDSSIP
ncbi:MAG: hypothetical protein ABIV47_21040 [Roseiflexaceae bacterium]